MSIGSGRVRLLSGSALVSLWCVGGVSLVCFGGMAVAQTPENPPGPQATPAQSAPGTLPPITVETTKKKPAKKETVRQAPARPAQPSTETAQEIATRQIQTQVTTFNNARSNIFTPVGANQDTISKEDIQRMPQGTNQPVDKVLLQFPGVSQDSAASGNLHVRNEHANVAYRINGIMLPDGVTGFGSFLETGLIGNMTLLTGALPAEFGLRTAAVVDIQARDGAFNGGGSVGVYGGSHDTFTTSAEYGGTIGGNCSARPLSPERFVKANPRPGDCGPVTEYFFTGRFYTSNLGIENPTPEPEAVHDLTKQERGFGYISTILDPTLRVSLITGASLGKFQIPTVPGGTAFPGLTSSFGFTNLDSSRLDENQQERTYYNVLSVQKSVNDVDFQLSYFNRYSSLHFVPDTIGDLFFNGIASDVYRATFANGIQGDGSYRVNDAHTLRAGFSVTTEKTQNTNLSTVEPCTSFDCTAFNDMPFTVTDATSKFGQLYAVYLQDEWKITNQLTINGGLRFDQMNEYTTANQLSPRISATYEPLPGTTFHTGYARYFTPPPQTIAAPVNLAFFQNPQPPNVTPLNPFGGTNSGAPPNTGESPVLPERANVYDAGITQVFSHGCAPVPSGGFTKAPPQVSHDCERLELGLDAYYKTARDLLDDGQFGAALVLSGFNYDKAYNEGVEGSLKYRNGGFQAYGNIAWGIQKGTNIISNQFLIDNTIPLADLGGLTRFQYIQTHYIFTDHTQIWTGSAGVSYSWYGTLLSANMIFGSGLRQGDANIDHLPAYTQVNAGVSHEFVGLTTMPFTLRFDVVNVFDTVYQIRSGTGLGVFAPQFGPRRGFFAGWSSKL
ncbi:MAG TPA: TonB-dependent receptor [Xanthobacteraceae bacterium]|jgi:outer membrane receptor protein involved in Fe transport